MEAIVGTTGAKAAILITSLSIISVFSYITVVLIFLWYLVLLFTFYRFLEDPKLADPGVDNLLEIISNELYVAVIPILVILLITTPTFALL